MQFTDSTRKTMKIKKWLRINANGAASITQGKPSVEWNEIAIQLNIEIPVAMFQRPHLMAKIKIPKEAAISDPITSEVIEDARIAIEQATGLNFSIKLVEQVDVDKGNY